MSRSGKLGTASIVMTVGAAIGLPATLPISPVLAVLAFVLGVLASLQGSKGWLAIPGLIVVVSLILLSVGLHAT